MATKAQIYAASREWYDNALTASLMMAEARLVAGEKPESWGSVAREFERFRDKWVRYERLLEALQRGNRK